ncbi:MAG: hypothetical protein ACKVS8_06735 [Phycisphaerales bacterium]
MNTSFNRRAFVNTCFIAAASALAAGAGLFVPALTGAGTSGGAGCCCGPACDACCPQGCPCPTSGACSETCCGEAAKPGAGAGNGCAAPACCPTGACGTK